MQNLAESGTANLYAQWKSVSFTITYELGGGTNHAENPIIYTASGDDIHLQDATREGSVFMGWYKGDEKVTEIIKGSTGNITLTAKWGFPGKFTVVNNGGNTFTITRNEDGSTGEQNMGLQTVYFRTVNSTAIGGTHFVPRGGSSAAVTFAEGAISQEITVDEHGVAKPYTTSDGTAIYQSAAYSNIDRTYELELVRVDGGGVLGGAAKATRTMAKQESHTIPSGFYQWTKITNGVNELYIESTSSPYYEENGKHQFTIDKYSLQNKSYADLKPYFAATAGTQGNLKLKINLTIREVYEGYQWIKITDIAPMAEGAYKAGETVTISVVFDEIVANANGVTITGTNLSGTWACTGGTGSNVLTFTGTLEKDCTAEDSVKDVTLNGTVFDMAN